MAWATSPGSCAARSRRCSSGERARPRDRHGADQARACTRDPPRRGHPLAHLEVDQLRDLRWRITDLLNTADTKRVAGVIAASWAQGLQLVDHLDPADLVAFADVLLDVDLALVDHPVVDTVVDAIEANDAWHILVDIALAADALSDDVRARLRQLVDHLPKVQVARFEAAANDLGHAGLLARVLQAEG